MSDDAAPTKRGRKANVEKVEKEKPEPKKRGRKVKTTHPIAILLNATKLYRKSQNLQLLRLQKIQVVTMRVQ